MFAPSRQDARRFFFDTWKKQQAGVALSDLEKLLASVIAAHPEYHAILDRPEQYGEREWLPEQGETNPFMHMSMHLAVEEQLSIDQPFGIRALYQQLLAKTGSEHDAQHEVIDCLGEMIWQAQRYGGGPDVNVYLSCIRGKLGLDQEHERRLNLKDMDD